jgi:hypothetical protein
MNPPSAQIVAEHEVGMAKERLAWIVANDLEEKEPSYTTLAIVNAIENLMRAIVTAELAKPKPRRRRAKPPTDTGLTGGDHIGKTSVPVKPAPVDNAGTLDGWTKIILNSRETP